MYFNIISTEILVTLIVAVITVGATIAIFVIKQIREKNTFNIAIIVEVHHLLNVVNQHKKWLMADKEHLVHHPLLPFSMDMFDTQAAQMGLMDRKIIDDVVRFYGFLKFINAYQASRDEHIKKGLTDDFCLRYLQLLNKLLREFGPMFMKHIKSNNYHKQHQLRKISLHVHDNDALETMVKQGTPH